MEKVFEEINRVIDQFDDTNSNVAVAALNAIGKISGILCMAGKREWLKEASAGQL